MRNWNGCIAYSAHCSQFSDILYSNSLIFQLRRSGRALVNMLKRFTALGYMTCLCIFIKICRYAHSSEPQLSDKLFHYY